MNMVGEKCMTILLCLAVKQASLTIFLSFHSPTQLVCTLSILSKHPAPPLPSSFSYTCLVFCFSEKRQTEERISSFHPLTCIFVYVFLSFLLLTWKNRLYSLLDTPLHLSISPIPCCPLMNNIPFIILLSFIIRIILYLPNHSPKPT